MPLSAALLALIIGAGRALAQDVEKEPQRPKIEQQRQTQEAGVAEDSAKLKVEGALDVTYEQILANPDDLELNYNYARAQVRRGDLKGASATLERMLLIDPNRSDIRLFYSVVLYRLDNVIEAQRELLLLSQQKLPSPMDSEVEKYLALVSRRLKKNHLPAVLASVFNTTPTVTLLRQRPWLFSDIPILLSPSSQRRDDMSVLFWADWNIAATSRKATRSSPGRLLSRRADPGQDDKPAGLFSWSLRCAAATS